MSAITDKQLGAAEKQFKQFEAMICSMTPQERSNPDLLAKARRTLDLVWLAFIRALHCKTLQECDMLSCSPQLVQHRCQG